MLAEGSATTPGRRSSLLRVRTLALALALAFLTGACDTGAPGGGADDPRDPIVGEAVGPAAAVPVAEPPSAVPSPSDDANSPPARAPAGGTAFGSSNAVAVDPFETMAIGDGDDADERPAPAAGSAPLDDFASATTPGFTARLLDGGAVRLNWRRDPNAGGYNVYRQGRYYTTVHTERFVDRKVSPGNTYRYEIHSFTKGQNKRFRKIAGGLTVAVRDLASGGGGGGNGSAGAKRDFASATTPGFTGRLLDGGAVRLNWRRDPNAGGYNVYRQGRYYTTVHTERFVDRKVSPGNTYRYEIHSFTKGQNKRFRKIAGGLTVAVRDLASGGGGGGNGSAGAKRDFASATTPGFTARLLDGGAVRLNWRRDPNAGGYNVYRQGRYYTTVHTERFVDRKVSPGNTYRYEIHSFTKGQNKRFRKIAGGLTVAVRDVGREVPENDDVPRPPAPKLPGGAGTVQRDFSSATTSGFTGRLLDDGTVRVSWREDPNAEGYNVYRRGEYYTTVRALSFVDRNVFDGDYYYEIQSFTPGDRKRYRTVATGLTVKVRGLGRTDPKAKVADPERLDGYQLVFADEFDGNRLDLDKWNTSYMWGADIVINSELQHYVDIENEPDFGFNPFKVGDGKLTIESIRTPERLKAKANGQPYLSGVITSFDSFRFTYGYAEMRARMPFGRGYWTAFWLLNARYGDGDPEIDIHEFLGHDQDVVYHTYHYYEPDGTLRSTTSEPTTGVDYTSGFHTFGVDWRPGRLVFYVDGIEVHRISDPEVSDQDMYLIANTAVGGWWPGSPDSSTRFPGRYEIDYIRVYRQIAPYELPPFSDQPSGIAPAASSLGLPPAHRPPFEVWPEGWPGRRR